MKDVYIVTDYPATYGTVVSAMSRVHGFGVMVNGTATFRAAVADLEKADSDTTTPTVAVLDLYLNGEAKGVELAQMLKARFPETEIIFFSRHIEEARELATAAGITVAAFIDKASEIAEGDVLLAIEAVFKKGEKPPLTDVVIPDDGWSWPEYPHLRLHGSFKLNGVLKKFDADCMIFDVGETTTAEGIQVRERGSFKPIPLNHIEEGILAATIVAWLKAGQEGCVPNRVRYPLPTD